MKKFNLVLVSILMLASFQALSQDALQPKPSPTDIAKINHKGTYIKITYARPHKKGRDVFGGLVPYGQVWRMGANDAAEITLTKEVKLAGNKVAAGTYSVFAIPTEKEWTLILNSELGQWGAYRYNEKADVLRFKVPSTATDTTFEPFTIKLEAKGEEVHWLIMWEDTKVVIPITFE